MLPTQFSISPVDVAARRALPLQAGLTVKVKQKIVEGDKTRLQTFEGLIISCRHGGEPGATFTVRRVSSGVGVEKTFPLYSPIIESVKIIGPAKVRRAKLYYMRDKSRREIRRKLKQSLTVEKMVEQAANVAAAIVSTPQEEAVV